VEETVQKLSAIEAKRRMVLQALVCLPALALFDRHKMQVAEPAGEELVEIGGWILRKSELA
jgi:hypothetical protein